jgi:sn-glycerol 3-phosphate transport system ATP-binding protein
MPVTVEYVEELGAQRLVHGLLGDQPITAVLAPDIDIPAELRLTIAPEKLHFFAADTGKRIVAADTDGASKPAMAAQPA